MTNHLKEVDQILDGHGGRDPVSREVVAKALQALSQNQIVYSDTHGISAEVFGFMTSHIGFLKSYFAAQAYEVVLDTGASMVGLKAGDVTLNRGAVRFKKDETLVGCVLRMLYDRDQGAADEYRRVTTSLDELVDLTAQLGGTFGQIEPRRMEEILAVLSRRGCVDLEDADKDGIRPLVVKPGIEIVIGDDFLNMLPQSLRHDSAPLAETEIPLDAGWDRVSPVASEKEFV